MSDDMTYSNRLAIFAEDALLPLWSLKEMLLDMSEGEATISPSSLAEVLESLLKQAESQFDAAEAALDKHVGHIQFVRAQAGYAGAATGKIVGVTLEPREAAHA